MKTSVNNQRRGFTLIEMVGVLAVIAILAALLVPKIFAAINESRFSNTVASINSVKAACMGHFGKTGNLGTNVGAGFDAELISAGQLERPFATKIGVSWAVSLSPLVSSNTFKLDGLTPITGSKVAFVEIAGVDAKDALELSKRIDGDTLSETASTTADANGRVLYTLPVAGVTDVLIYLADK